MLWSWIRSDVEGWIGVNSLVHVKCLGKMACLRVGLSSRSAHQYVNILVAEFKIIDELTFSLVPILLRFRCCPIIRESMQLDCPITTSHGAVI